MMKNYGKLGEGSKPATEENRPKCRIHRKFMVYNAAEDRMECKQDDCDQVATKRRTFKNALGADLDGSPVTYRGPLEFVTDAEGDLYLFLPDVNAVIQLEGLQSAKPFEADPQAARKAVRFMDAVAAHIPAAAAAALAIKRREKATRDTEEIADRMRRRQDFREQRVRYTTKTPPMKLLGVTLPPHINNVTQLHEIKRRVDLMHKEDVKRGGTGISSEYIARALADMAEELSPAGDLHIFYFTADGREVFDEWVAPGAWKTGGMINVQGTMRTTLEALDKNNPSEGPHYGMFGGKPWSLNGNGRMANDSPVVKMMKQAEIHALDFDESDGSEPSLNLKRVTEEAWRRLRDRRA